MEDETSNNAKELYGYINFNLSVFHSKIEKIVALLSDHTSTNSTFSGVVGRTLVGCNSHHFNLRANDLLVQKRIMVDKIQAHIKMLSY